VPKAILFRLLSYEQIEELFRYSTCFRCFIRADLLKSTMNFKKIE